MLTKYVLTKFMIITVSTAVFLGTIFAQTKTEEASMIPFDKGIIAGRASWYSKNDPGIKRHTANMEIFDDSMLTAAMWDVPFNQKVRVTNIENGKSVIVRINDRGPHKRFVRKGRVIDLTKTAFKRISGTKRGLIRVQVEFL